MYGTDAHLKLSEKIVEFKIRLVRRGIATENLDANNPKCHNFRVLKFVSYCDSITYDPNRSPVEAIVWNLPRRFIINAI